MMTPATAWLVALSLLAAAPPAPTPAPDLLLDVPPQGFGALFVPAPETLSLALEQLLTRGHQRTLTTLLGRVRQNMRLQFGLDFMRPETMAQAGLDAAAGIAWVWPEQNDKPVALAAVTDAQALQRALVAATGSAYAPARARALEVAGHAGTALYVGTAQAPRALFVVRQGRVWLGGPGSEGVLERALRQADHPQKAIESELLAHRKALGPAQAYGVGRESPKAPRVLSALALGPQSVTARSVLPSQLGQLLCTSAAAARAAEAQALARNVKEALGGDLLGLTSGSSTQALAQVLVGLQHSHAQDSLTNPAARALWARAEAALGPWPKRLAELDAPWALAVAGRQPEPTGVVRPQALVAAALALRAQSAHDRALFKRWLQAGPGKTDADLRLFLRGDTLWALRGPVQAPLATAAPAPVPEVTQTAWVGEASLAHAARWAQTLVMTGERGPLGDTALGAMPHLMLLGPTGDALRELEALGEVQAQVQCAPWGAVFRAQICMLDDARG